MKKVSLLLSLLTLLFVSCPPPVETVKVSFDVNQADNKEFKGETPATIEVEKGTVLSEEQLAPLENTANYIFVGWYDGENKVEAGYEVTMDVLLEARWAEKEKVTVSFDVNSAVNSECSEARESLEVYAGTVLSEEQLAPLANTANYIFVGWYDGMDEVKAGDIAIGNLTLLAHWRSGKTIIFDINAKDCDFECEENLEPIEFDTYYILADDDRLSDTQHYEFGGWSHGEGLINVDDKLSSSSTLVAKWVAKKYTVTFKANKDINPEYSGDETVFQLPVPYKTQEKLPPEFKLSDTASYLFKGWYDSEDPTETLIRTLRVTGDMTLLAKWEKKIITYLSPGTEGTAGTEATYILFGSWPQKIISDTVTVDKKTAEQKKVGMFTYYKGSDGEWYCEALENAYGTEAQYIYSTGTQVKQSGENSYQWFKEEPIKWRVLTDNYSGKKLLVAESGLMASVPYYDQDNINRDIGVNNIYSNNYEHSRIRAWLNGLSFQLNSATNSDYNGKGFLQTAFTAEEQAAIAMTTVDNSVESTGDTSNSYVCGNTNDRVFLLSYTEANNNAYFANNNARIRKPTDFALANYAYLSSTEAYGGEYFLRSPFCETNRRARCVSPDGNSNSTTYVDYDYALVVPALCIE